MGDLKKKLSVNTESIWHQLSHFKVQTIWELNPEHNKIAAIQASVLYIVLPCSLTSLTSKKSSH